MADEQSYEDKVSQELADQYKAEGEEVDKAVESNREDVEKATEEARLEEERKDKELRDYQLGVTTDATGQPTSGPAVAQSAAGPVEEVASERAAEAQEAGADDDNLNAAQDQAEAQAEGESTSDDDSNE